MFRTPDNVMMESRFSTTNRLKISIGLGALAVFAVMVAVTWFSMSSLDAAIKTTATLLETSDAKKGHAREMRELVRQRSAAINDLWLADDPMNRDFLLGQTMERTRQYRARQAALAMISRRSLSA